MICFFFFFNDTATTEIYTLSLHDALPISTAPAAAKSLAAWTDSLKPGARTPATTGTRPAAASTVTDRKSTRLNSSHQIISYAVFCLKKKKKKKHTKD